MLCGYFFFFNDTATTEIYTLSLHDALPISPDAVHGHHPRADRVLAGVRPDLHRHPGRAGEDDAHARVPVLPGVVPAERDRKSTRLNSSHANISYAVFCLKKKNTNSQSRRRI